jgi:patatin-like phospholipase/acyl hydrolase
MILFGIGATSPFEGCHSAPIWEAARATSAAPYYFASYDKEGVGNLIDGGILTNNPVQVACEEAVRYFHAQRINCIVSIGTGIQMPPEKQHNKSLARKLIDLARGAGFAPIIDRLGDLLNLAPMLIDIVTGSEMTHDLTEPISAALGVRYYRLNATVPATNLADCSDEALNALVSNSQEYITKQRDLFSEVAKVLMEEHSP